MRTVFSNHQEVCHVWASQQQAEGRASRIFFAGPSIYSYGRHFEMARFVKADVVLINNASYSSSTSKHQGHMRHAIGAHITTFRVPSFSDHAANLAYFFDQANASMEKALKARTNAEGLSKQADSYLSQAIKYLNTFPSALKQAGKEARKEIQGHFKRMKDGPYFSPEVLETIKAKAKAASIEKAKQNKLDAEKRRLREIELAKTNAEALEDWKQGKQVFRWLNETALRVKDNEVQTSHGATVPLIEARKLYRALKAKVNLIGQRVGLFEVRELTETDLVVGCHVIPLAEIERIAPEVMSAVIKPCGDCLEVGGHGVNCASAGGGA